ncbi:MAG: DUF1150 family protein [Pseudorhodoplanes sp.]|jgi:hypothetical protein|nr:DUF1150 family protein [Pseudorhodoplanes sp.]
MRPGLSDPEFATFGKGRLAYIRRIPSERVAFLCAEAPMLPPGYVVFVLHSADGRPVLVTGSRESAVANAADSHLDAMYIT